MHVVKSAMSTAYNIDLPTISEDAASAVIVAIAPCAMEPIKSPADSSFSAKLRAFSVLVNFDSMACVTVPDSILYKFAHFVTFDYSTTYSITKTLALFLNFSLICSHTREHRPDAVFGGGAYLSCFKKLTESKKLPPIHSLFSKLFSTNS